MEKNIDFNENQLIHAMMRIKLDSRKHERIVCIQANNRSNTMITKLVQLTESVAYRAV